MYIKNKDDLKYKKGEHGCLIGDMLSGLKNVSTEYSACIRKLPAGKTTIKHSHRNCDELYYILSGTARLTIDNEIKDIKKGDLIIIPENSPHQLENTGNAQFEFLAIGFTGNLYNGWNTWI